MKEKDNIGKCLHSVILIQFLEKSKERRRRVSDAQSNILLGS
jgi:hypothetical protein